MDTTLDVATGRSSPKTRKAMLQYQDRHFKRLLNHVWTRSPFYRDYYTSHGINEKDFADISISDLPLLPKKTLIDNFDRAVTDARLRKDELQDWFESHHDPSETFCKDLVVIHGSGTSGDIGIFAYDRGSWAIADATVAGQLPQPENYLNGKTKVAFYIVGGSGHFASVAMVNSMPRNVYNTLILPLLSPLEQTVRQLNDFQPHRLSGYSSSVAELAEQALQGKLNIHLQTVIVYGDKLTQSMERKIREAWGVPLYVLYATAESKYIAVRSPERDQFRVMDDLNIVEVLDENDQAVGPGEEGRVVLTNLYNYTLPLLRYELGDYVVKGLDRRDEPFSTLNDIRGRVNDALPIVLPSGVQDTIHPLVLTTLFVPTVEKLQFISVTPEHVRIDYVSPQNMDAAIREEFQELLDAKGAVKTTVEVRNVPAIDNDPKTGKLRLVKFEGREAKHSHRVTIAELPETAPSRVNVKPHSSFVPFAREDIEQSIPARFKQQVDKCGDRLAIKSGDFALSYTELNRAANRIAHAIIGRLGVATVPVGLLLPHDVSAAVAILGILKAGKCYVPLDPDYPAVRLATIFEESQAALLLTDEADLPSAREFLRDPEKILNIDSLDASLPAGDPSLSISQDSLAYLFYTSGSTGCPKGVVQNHRNVLHQIMTYTNDLKISPDDRVTQLHSHAFSASRLDIFGALLNGAALYPVSLPKEGMDRLARRLIDDEITILHWIPTAFRYFGNALDKTAPHPKLRLLVLGSEPLTSQDLELYRRHFSSNTILVNRYGATETGNIRWYFLNQQTALRGGPVPVGYAIEDTEVLLLDEAGRTVGKNEIGEIAIKSSYLSPGYWRRPDLTAEAFSPAPGEPDKLIYRTGDMGRFLEDGCLVHLGRKDFQAKIRGHRIEAGEVERALLNHPAVSAASVMVRQDKDANNYLAAYYVAGNTPAPDSSALRNYLNAQLPNYMVPAAFVRLETLPLTPNGKLNRNALPEPEQLRAHGETPPVEPRTSIEMILVQIWSRVLGIASFGIHDNFFDLGGHSLHAMMILSSAASNFKVEVSLPEFFELPTVAHMACLIGSTNETNATETEFASLLDVVESLPDEEVSLLIEKEGQTENRAWGLRAERKE